MRENHHHRVVAQTKSAGSNLEMTFSLPFLPSAISSQKPSQLHVSLAQAEPTAQVDLFSTLSGLIWSFPLFQLVLISESGRVHQRKQIDQRPPTKVGERTKDTR